jgi:hypothetical protein
MKSVCEEWTLVHLLAREPERLERGMALLTVETEVSGDSKSTNESGTSLVGSLGLSCSHKRFLFSLGCSSRPSTKYFFFLIVHRISVPLSPLPNAHQAGQASPIS